MIVLCSFYTKIHGVSEIMFTEVTVNFVAAISLEFVNTLTCKTSYGQHSLNVSNYAVISIFI